MHLLTEHLKIEKTFLGLIPYSEALSLMEEQIQKMPPQTAYFWGLEHPLVYTKGLKTEAHDILDDKIEVVSARRGGSVTLHNPGQLVVYFCFPLDALRGGLERFVRVLEATMAETFLRFGVPANLKPNASGVFTSKGKIAFVGLGLKKRTVYHGVSMNIANSLADFSPIHSCGLTIPMSNLAAFAPDPQPTSEEVFDVFAMLLERKCIPLDKNLFRERYEMEYDLSDWRLGMKLGWLAFHERRYWESHEIWELYWHVMEKGDLRTFFHGLIQTAMAYYKKFTAPGSDGGYSLLTKALEKFAASENILFLENQSDFILYLKNVQSQLKENPAADIGMPPVYGWLETY